MLHCVFFFVTFCQLILTASLWEKVYDHPHTPIFQKVQTTYLTEAKELEAMGLGLSTDFSYATVYNLNHSVKPPFSSPPALSG